MNRQAQNFVTILTKIHPSIPYEYKNKNNREVKTSLRRIEDSIDKNLGNYSHKQVNTENNEGHVELKLDATGLIHFASMHVIAGQKNTNEPHYLFLELTVDGPPEVAIDAFVNALEPELIKIYSIIDSRLNSKTRISEKLIDDQYEIKRSPWPTFFNPKSINGLPFSGTAGLDLKDMHDDAIISEYAQKTIQKISKENELNSTRSASFEKKSSGKLYLDVKKSIIENISDEELSRAWHQATNRKTTPNFAEQMDSDWREDWTQFKLFSSIIPSWVKSAGFLIYLSVFFILSYIFSLVVNPINEKKVHDLSAKIDPIKWEKLRFTGSPHCEFHINNANVIKCIDYKGPLSFYPWFLIEGLLIAFTLFFLLRLAPPLFKKASGALTLVVGFNLFLWFPNFFNFNKLNNLTSKTSVSEVSEKFPFAEFFAIMFICIAIYAVAICVKWVLNLNVSEHNFRKYKNLNSTFISTGTWLHFIVAIAALASYLYLGKEFLDLNSREIKSVYVHGVSPIVRIDQFVLVPMILSSILSLNIMAIYFHRPRSIKKLESKLSNFKITLGNYIPKVGKMEFGKSFGVFSVLLIYMFSHYSIYLLIFTEKQDISGGIIKLLSAVMLASILGVFSCYISSILTNRKFNPKPFIFLAIIFWLFVLNNAAGDRALSIYTNLVISIPITLFVIILILAVALGTYLKSEHKNKQNYDNPYTDVTEKLFENENRVVQNHMISVQRLIPEYFRRSITLPLMLQAIGGVLGKQRFRPGFLANVGTVHSARWLHLPDTNNYVFVSNYDGSFESYLEDFSKHAIQGTNLAWSNCVGFPKLKGLFKGGVQDSNRFKRYARRSMQQTRFWYSAVSNKSAEQIRRNALIRDGLTQDNISASQAQAWLDLFSSIPRPEWIIEKDQVQNILFGANKKLTEGGMFTIKKTSNYTANEFTEIFSTWINGIKHLITFDGESPKDTAVYMAFSAEGLRALQLDDVLDDNSQNNKNQEKGRTFSQPFVSGMSHQSRRHILGDIGNNSSDHWQWSDEDILAVILIYAKEDIVDSEGNIHEEFEDFHSIPGLEVNLEQQFKSLRPEEASYPDNITPKIKVWNNNKPSKSYPKEPFGFADGISQPILKGTKSEQKHPGSIHLVEPGEFILGYRDNSGYFPPSPVINAELDLENLLPNPTEDIIQRYPSFDTLHSPENRDLGRNGSYLVIRKLEQDVDVFKRTAMIGAALLLLKDEKNIYSKATSDLQDDEFYFHSINSEAMTLLEQSSLNYDGRISSGNGASQFDVINFLEIANPTNTVHLKVLQVIFDNLTKKRPDDFKNYREWIECLFVGRHKDGTSLIKRPLRLQKQKDGVIKMTDESIDTSQVSEEKKIERDPKKIQNENEFLFKAEDPQGYKCPIGSHIRRANPRDGLDIESKDSLAVTQRHRILRRGRSYNELDNKKNKKEGTFFMCLNADIDRQFELIQQTWLMSSKFHGLRDEIDPIAGQSLSKDISKASKFTIQSEGGDIQLPCMSNFVTVRAGGYFFLPGKATLDFLGALHKAKY